MQLEFQSIQRNDFENIVNKLESIPQAKKAELLSYLDKLIRISPEENENPLIDSEKIRDAVNLLSQKNSDINSTQVIESINEIYQQSYSQVLKQVHQIAATANKKLPASDRAAKIPRIAVVASTKPEDIAQGYDGPIAILIPETHIADKANKALANIPGATAHTLKLTNIALVEELVSSPNLKISNALNESQIDYSYNLINPDEAKQDDQAEAINAFAYSAKRDGIELKPAESSRHRIKQGLALEIYQFVKGYIDGTVTQSRLDLFAHFESVEKRYKVDGDNETTFELMTRKGDEFMSDLGLDSMFEISKDKYLNFKPSFFQAQTPDSLLSIERKLYDFYHQLNDSRDNEISQSFKESKGITPMIIGSNHLQERLVQKLQGQGIPMIIVGAEEYKGQVSL